MFVWLRHPAVLLILAPLLWLALFFLFPLLIVGKISVAESVIGQPPFTSLFVPDESGAMQPRVLWDNFLLLWDDSFYRDTYIYSVKIAVVATLICLVIAYPMAYCIWRAPARYRTALLLLVMLPFWTSFLIRIYAWIGLLKDNGVINTLLLWTGMLDRPLPMLYNDFALYIGIVYAYLPFMVLPIYAALSRLDSAQFEAASDLGGKPLRIFFTIIVPQTWAGIIAGCMLVFIPAVGEFVIPDLLGGPNNLMIGRLLWTEFFTNHDWPVASAMAIIMLLILAMPIMLLMRMERREIT